MKTFSIDANEIRVTFVDMKQLLVSMGFVKSKSEASRRIKEGAVTVVEIEDGETQYRKATFEEPLLTHAKRTTTLIRCGKQMKKVRFSV